ncbi:MAG: carboxysome shell carbonic anhydrase [Thiobacillus sp.]|uniref:carboxysome shell carbonic anhydrase n=1 Tax=Thiobacillus sp. TaxID=924 RepID=UPI0027367D9B|nr:carboxysome shell carbonic anhydrase [Thiobacillus sp.]MDP3585533.1 carboxysome shell carbonic anhydrase [Thiobacillus sp.]
MNTRKRLAAMHSAGYLRQGEESSANQACVIASGQRCEHALVDPELNRRLYTYEKQVRGRFAPIVDTLKALSAFQHEMDFESRAQRVAQDKLGYGLPQELLENAWVNGLDLRALHSYCIFRSFKECIDMAESDQQPWRERMLIDAEFIRSCGYHTIDVSPCADGRLQGLLPFVFRMAPNDAVYVKAYAGALFDVEGDVADWTHRELERLAGFMPGGESGNYLKIAVYHYSTSNPCQQGCAAHGSNDALATQEAADRLAELRAAIENTYGRGAAPDTLLIGMDTDTDAIRVHLPDSESGNCPMRFVESAQLFRDTLGMDAQSARSAIEAAVVRAENSCGLQPGMRKLIVRLLESNLSQIEYVIHHHEGRYSVIGHDEAFICAGEATNYVQLRNKYYYAHLDTVEEGAPDMDVGIKIFSGLNVHRGLAVPVLVHFHYSSRVPGSRERTVSRCRRVKAAIQGRYRNLHEQGLLYCQMAVSDRQGSERCTFIEDLAGQAGH